MIKTGIAFLLSLVLMVVILVLAGQVQWATTVGIVGVGGSVGFVLPHIGVAYSH